MYNNESPEEILIMAEEQLQINPSDQEAMYYKGIALSELRQSNEALNCFEQILLTNKEHPGVWYQKGIVLNDLGRYVEAIKCFKKALSIDKEFDLASISKDIAQDLLKSINQNKIKTQ